MTKMSKMSTLSRPLPCVVGRMESWVCLLTTLLQFHWTTSSGLPMDTQSLEKVIGCMKVRASLIAMCGYCDIRIIHKNIITHICLRYCDAWCLGLDCVVQEVNRHTAYPPNVSAYASLGCWTPRTHCHTKQNMFGANHNVSTQILHVHMRPTPASSSAPTTPPPTCNGELRARRTKWRLALYMRAQAWQSLTSVRCNSNGSHHQHFA